MRLKPVSLFLAFVLFVPAMAEAGRREYELPAPRLMAPDDVANLAGKDKLEFRWDSAGTNFTYYDFTIYKGSQPYEPYILLKEKIPAGTTTYRVDASKFTPGETYSWSLRYNGGSQKGRRAYSIFKVQA